MTPVLPCSDITLRARFSKNLLYESHESGLGTEVFRRRRAGSGDGFQLATVRLQEPERLKALHQL